MKDGYLWSINYSRCQRDGISESIQTKLHLAVYMKSKSLLVYHCGDDKSTIEKVIVRRFVDCSNVDDFAV